MYRNLTVIIAVTALILMFSVEICKAGQSPMDQLQQFMTQRGGGAQSSEARNAASRVVAVADDRTNTVIISAPADVLVEIEKLISSIDVSTQAGMEMRVFPMKYADAEQMATTITNVFEEVLAAGAGQTRTSQMGGRGFSQRQSTSQRQLQESTVVAVADVRTNSVIVSAVGDVMKQIETMVIALDNNPARSQQVYVYPIKHADPEQVSTIVQDMLDQQQSRASGTTVRRSTSTTNRQGTTGTGSTNTNRSGTTGGNTRSTGSSTGMGLSGIGPSSTR